MEPTLYFLNDFCKTNNTIVNLKHVDLISIQPQEEGKCSVIFNFNSRSELKFHFENANDAINYLENLFISYKIHCDTEKRNSLYLK